MKATMELEFDKVAGVARYRCTGCDEHGPVPGMVGARRWLAEFAKEHTHEEGKG